MKKQGYRLERGNVLFFILIAVVLLGALTAAVTRSERGVSTMDREQTGLTINQVLGFAGDVKRAVEGLVRLGISEGRLSFAHTELEHYGTPNTDERAEVFHIAGGGAAFVNVPKNINDGSMWEFYGFSAAPGLGDANEPELMLVLPNVSDNFCEAFNKKAGLSSQPKDMGTCVHTTANRFAGNFASSSAVNVLDETEFTRVPAPTACVRCATQNHIYYVLLER